MKCRKGQNASDRLPRVGSAGRAEPRKPLGVGTVVKWARLSCLLGGLIGIALDKLLQTAYFGICIPDDWNMGVKLAYSPWASPISVEEG